MEYCFLTQPQDYDGSQLQSLWAYRNYGIQGDSIVAFTGGCNIPFHHMVDLEDVRDLSPIYSSLMLHFIVEHFDLDLEKTIWRQRILITIIKELVEQKTDIKLVRDGDDLFYQDKKLSISIATLSPVSTMIHAGLNLDSKNTPVPTISLTELGINDIDTFAEEILKGYNKENKSVSLARCKVRGVK